MNNKSQELEDIEFDLKLDSLVKERLLEDEYWEKRGGLIITDYVRKGFIYTIYDEDSAKYKNAKINDLINEKYKKLKNE